MSLIENASIVEMVQLLVAVIGMVYTFWGVWEATLNAVELSDTPPTDLRRLVAMNKIRGELASMLIQFCLVTMGVISVILPPPPQSILEAASKELLQNVLIRFGLMTVTIILALDAIAERYHYKQFMARVGKLEELKSTNGSKIEVTVK